MMVLASAVAVVAAPTPARADDCITVDMAVQLNQYPLMPDLAKRFNGSDDAQVDGRCIHVSVSSKSSGAAATLLEQGWPNPAQNGPKPVVWSPASNSWRSILNQRLADAGRDPRWRRQGTPVMVSPLVIAMPKPMAKRARLARHADRLLRHPRARDRPDGLGREGPCRVGRVQARQDEPQLLDQRPVVADRRVLRVRPARRRDLTPEDLDRRRRRAVQAHDVESAVVHYGDTTLTFLNNCTAADQRGTRARPTCRRSRSRSSRSSTTTTATPTASSTRREAAAAHACRWWRSTRRKARSSPTTRSSSSTPSG